MKFAIGCLVICGIVSILAGASIFGVYETYGPGGAARATWCRSNVKQALQAVIMYAEDNDGRLPQADRWMDSTVKFTRSRDVYRCPEMWREGGFGYAMNSQLSGILTTTVKQPGIRPLIYDSTNLSWNANDEFASTPQPERHRKGNMVGYLDGNVKPH